MTETWIRLNSNAVINPAELVWRVSRSGGPGGQHANTSDTRVEVILDLRRCTSLSAWHRSQLTARLGPVVRAVSADSRSQARNREVALERLVSKLRAGLRVDPPRRATKPSRGARENRLRSKQQRADIKRGRARPRPDDEV
ncbi:MAG: aminoacyl-tRNA hydrolase [Acidimicrobiia bacterium]|nr:aminoacyl-tRNA hydrolase [Acidimicrobiia bacterium]